ncbi:MAG TPA: ATP-binding protein, partial [Bryobacteraceae bacterium]|nr:ATP-binding protein [Bryobacteraceae bacterium]
QLREVLKEEWAAVRGYLRIERPKGRARSQPDVQWYYDQDDPEEALIVDRLRQAYLLTDSEGRIIQIGPEYRNLLLDTPHEIQQVLRSKEPVWQVKRSATGATFLIRSGVLVGEDDRPYYLAIGRSYELGNRIIQEFTHYYSILLPLMIFSASVLGWFMAGRALRPVNELARTAQRITGSNTTVQIPSRGANDELDRLIEAFNRMIERLDASLQQARQFSTDVSHELRTPLTAIRGQLEVALLAAKTPEQYHEAIVNALEDVERLSQTIRALLLLSQAESGQLVLQRQQLNVCALVSQIVEQFEIPAEGNQLTLQSNLTQDCTISADRIQLERLVSNLLSNAIKYTPEGGTVTVTVRDLERDVTIIIEDTGVGIPAESLPHIFDRFYRVPTENGADLNPERGLGLGLSFVAWIVKAHRGSINVESSPGHGTRFTVRLPKEPASAPQIASAPMPARV